MSVELRDLLRMTSLVGVAVALAPTSILADWGDDWAVAPGFSLAVDSEGFDFPSAIAVVPEPGPDPKDPRYFVTELRGSVSVVANDGSVSTFASDFHHFEPKDELPGGFEGQGGLAGICLDPANGYVFVTFIYRDGSAIKNGMVRFATRPGRFALEPTSMLDLRGLFEPDDGGVTHQIGGCRVAGEHLYVGVGDGWNPASASDLGSTLGKVLRLDLDGEPLPGNPLPASRGRAAPAIFAWGFRNPFGIAVTGGDRVWVAENGVNADRFLEIEAGRNYLWDGSDISITNNAAVVFPDAVSPVQVDYVPRDAGFAGGFAGDFLIALSGNPAKPGNDRGRTRGLVAISYDFGEGRVTRVPHYLIEFLGTGFQSPVGVGVGPDAIYFVPLFPHSDGRSAVLRIAYDPKNEHRHVVGRPDTSDRDAWARYLIDRRGCLGCHTKNGYGGTAAPPLDRDTLVASLEERLADPGYRETVAAIDELDREPFASYAEARAEVLAASGQHRLRLWTTYHIMEPRFDSPGAQMPNLGLTKDEASAITDVLLAPESWEARIKRHLPKPRYVHIVAGFGLGALAGLILAWAARKLFAR